MRSGKYKKTEFEPRNPLSNKRPQIELLSFFISVFLLSLSLDHPENAEPGLWRVLWVFGHARPVPVGSGHDCVHRDGPRRADGERFRRRGLPVAEQHPGGGQQLYPQHRKLWLRDAARPAAARDEGQEWDYFLGFFLMGSILICCVLTFQVTLSCRLWRAESTTKMQWNFWGNKKLAS